MLTVLVIIVVLLAVILLLAAVVARDTLAPQPQPWRDCGVQADSVVTIIYSSTQSSDDLDCEADDAMLRGDVARARLLRDLADAQRVRDQLQRDELRWRRENPTVRVRQHGIRGLEA